MTRYSAIPWPLRPIVRAPAPGTWGVGLPQGGGRVAGSGDGPAPNADGERDWSPWKTAAVFGGLAVVLGPILFSIGLTSLTSRRAHEREAVTW